MGYQVEGDAVPQDGGTARLVTLSHPLSDGFEIGGRPGTPLTLDRVERWLTRDPVAWHVELLSTAPEPENPESVRSVIRYAEMFAWTNLEVKAVAGVLVEAGAVSDEEYDWLRNTVGEVAPDAPRPNTLPIVYRDYRYRRKA